MTMLGRATSPRSRVGTALSFIAGAAIASTICFSFDRSREPDRDEAARAHRIGSLAGPLAAPTGIAANDCDSAFDVRPNAIPPLDDVMRGGAAHDTLFALLHHARENPAAVASAIRTGAATRGGRFSGDVLDALAAVSSSDRDIAAAVHHYVRTVLAEREPDNVTTALSMLASAPELARQFRTDVARIAQDGQAPSQAAAIAAISVRGDDAIERADVLKTLSAGLESTAPEVRSAALIKLAEANPPGQRLPTEIARSLEESDPMLLDAGFTAALTSRWHGDARARARAFEVAVDGSAPAHTRLAALSWLETLGTLDAEGVHRLGIVADALRDVPDASR